MTSSLKNLLISNSEFFSLMMSPIGPNHFSLVVDVRPFHKFKVAHWPSAIPVHITEKDIDVIDLKELTNRVQTADEYEKELFAERESHNVCIIQDSVPKDEIQKSVGFFLANLLQKEKKAKSVRLLQEGYREFDELYPFLSCKFTDEKIHKHRTDILNRRYPSEILPGFLFLGSHTDALNIEQLAQLQITHVLTVAAELKMNYNESKHPLKHFQVHIDDQVNESIRQLFDRAFQFIDSCAESKGRVLVHCKLGRSRSSSVVIAYLMNRLKKSLKESYELALANRSIVDPNIGFWEQLGMYEFELQRNSSSSFVSTLPSCVNMQLITNDMARRNFPQREFELLCKFIQQANLPPPVYTPVDDPSGHFLSASNGGVIQLWDLSTKKVIDEQQLKDSEHQNQDKKQFGDGDMKSCCLAAINGP